MLVYHSFFFWLVVFVLKVLLVPFTWIYSVHTVDLIQIWVPSTISYIWENWTISIMSIRLIWFCLLWFQTMNLVIIQNLRWSLLRNRLLSFHWVRQGHSPSFLLWGAFRRWWVMFYLNIYRFWSFKRWTSITSVHTEDFNCTSALTDRLVIAGIEVSFNISMNIKIIVTIHV